MLYTFYHNLKALKLWLKGVPLSTFCNTAKPNARAHGSGAVIILHKSSRWFTGCIFLPSHHTHSSATWLCCSFYQEVETYSSIPLNRVPFVQQNGDNNVSPRAWAPRGLEASAFTSGKLPETTVHTTGLARPRCPWQRTHRHCARRSFSQDAWEAPEAAGTNHQTCEWGQLGPPSPDDPPAKRSCEGNPLANPETHEKQLDLSPNSVVDFYTAKASWQEKLKVQMHFWASLGVRCGHSACPHCWVSAPRGFC